MRFELKYHAYARSVPLAPICKLNELPANTNWSVRFDVMTGGASTFRVKTRLSNPSSSQSLNTWTVYLPALAAEALVITKVDVRLVSSLPSSRHSNVTGELERTSNLRIICS